LAASVGDVVHGGHSVEVDGQDDAPDLCERLVIIGAGGFVGPV
jgi:hypothetical protein